MRALFLVVPLLLAGTAYADEPEAEPTPEPTPEEVHAEMVESGVTAVDAPMHAELFAPFEASEGATILTATYRGFYGPFKMGTITLQATFDGDAYEVTSFLKTEGIVDWLAPNDLRTQTLGRLDGLARTPEIYRSQLFKKNDDNQLVELQYTEDGAMLWSEPAYNLQRYPVSAEDIAGSADPLSSLILIGINGGADEPACVGRARVFDGKRRYDLNLSFVRKEKMRGRRSIDYQGHAHRCAVMYEQVAGFKRQKKADRAADLWLADIEEFGLRAPVRIKYGTEFGNVVLKARELKVTGPDGRVMLAGRCDEETMVCETKG